MYRLVKKSNIQKFSIIILPDDATVFEYSSYIFREFIFKVNNVYNCWCCGRWIERFPEMLGIWSPLRVCQLVAGITKAKVNYF